MMKKRILSFILVTLILIPLLLSCGGEMPEMTPEPTTPEAEAPEPETPTMESVPYESTFTNMLYTWDASDIDADKYMKITVIRSKEEFELFAKYVEEEISSHMQWLRTEAEEKIFYASMKTISRFYEISQAISRYNKEHFFEDNVLLFIYHSSNAEDIITTDVSVKENGGKKELYIQQLLWRETNFGSDVSVTRCVLLAIPSDIGVDFEHDVVVNAEPVYGSLYQVRGSTLYHYTEQHWTWKLKENK